MVIKVLAGHLVSKCCYLVGLQELSLCLTQLSAAKCTRKATCLKKVCRVAVNVGLSRAPNRFGSVPSNRSGSASVPRWQKIWVLCHSGSGQKYGFCSGFGFRFSSGSPPCYRMLRRVNGARCANVTILAT